VVCVDMVDPYLFVKNNRLIYAKCAYRCFRQRQNIVFAHFRLMSKVIRVSLPHWCKVAR